jgi:alkylhydroperoxidase family enzyme
MARLKLLKPAEVDESIKELVPQIVGLRGKFLNLHAVLANSPKALQAFMGFSRYVRDDSDFDPRLRELATLLVGHIHNNPYEVAHHRPIAIRLGYSEEKVDAIPNFESSALFSAKEKAMLAYCRQVLTGYRVSNEVFAELEKHFDPTAIIDLSLILGWYQLCSSILLPLQVEIEQS